MHSNQRYSTMRTVVRLSKWIFRGYYSNFTAEILIYKWWCCMFTLYLCLTENIVSFFLNCTNIFLIIHSSIDVHKHSLITNISVCIHKHFLINHNWVCVSVCTFIHHKYFSLCAQAFFIINISVSVYTSIF